MVWNDVFGGEDIPENKHFEGLAKDGVRYDAFRNQWRPGDMLQRVLVEIDGVEYTWLELLNDGVQVLFPGEEVSTVKGEKRLPVAAMVSHPREEGVAGPDQKYHRDYPIATLQKWIREGVVVPKFAILALQHGTKLKLVPGSHIPGARIGKYTSLKFEALSANVQEDYLNEIAIVVELKIGEMVIVSGCMLHAGVGYKVANVHIHRSTPPPPIQSRVRFIPSTNYAVFISRSHI